MKQFLSFKKYITIITIAYKYLIQRIIMVKKGLLMAFILMFAACAGAIKIAEEDKKGSTIPKKNIIVKPSQ